VLLLKLFLKAKSGVEVIPVFVVLGENGWEVQEL